MSEIEELLVEMLKIPSVSGEEKMMGEFLVSKLGDFQIEKQFIDKDRFNVIAKKGNPEIYIVVHMDTVPGVVPVKITKDKIFGRGAIDNKGNIAGAIMASKKFDNIGLIFTVGEEDDFAGAKKINIKKGKFIVMEPTNMKIMTRQRGLIAATISTKGIQKHSSLEFKREDSALYNLTDILSRLYKKNWTAFNAIVTNGGGSADNIVSAFAEAKILMRPGNMIEFEKIITFLAQFKQKNISIKIHDKIKPCESFLVKNGGTVPFFSEMAFFKDSLLFGVGDISIAHTIDEYVYRKELNQLEKNLSQLILDLEK
jgi:acetylornithine deacetylase/succinyl-diaminopimelate desuccinylase-like protein